MFGWKQPKKKLFILVYCVSSSVSASVSASVHKGLSSTAAVLWCYCAAGVQQPQRYQNGSKFSDKGGKSGLHCAQLHILKHYYTLFYTIVDPCSHLCTIKSNFVKPWDGKTISHFWANLFNISWLLKCSLAVQFIQRFETFVSLPESLRVFVMFQF